MIITHFSATASRTGHARNLPRQDRGSRSSSGVGRIGWAFFLSTLWVGTQPITSLWSDEVSDKPEGREFAGISL